MNGAKALVNPALVMVAAVAPLALIAGGLVLLFGGRRGMQIIGTSLGVLLLLGSVSMVLSGGMLRRSRQGLLAFGSALGGLFVVAAVWIGWMSMQIGV